MSTFDQSLIARRQQHHRCSAQTSVEFEPETFQQMAGLIAYYNTQNHAWLRMSRNEEQKQNSLVVCGNDNGIYQEWSDEILIDSWSKVYMRVIFDLKTFHFEYSLDDTAWFQIGDKLSAKLLSDEYATRFDGGYARSFGFTGNYLGMLCSDLSGRKKHADFDYFEYKAL